MAAITGISWCDSTANAVVGCEKCSPGCLNCYAEHSTPARQLRARGIETWGPNAVRYETKGFERAMLAFNRFPWICDECGKATDAPGHGHHFTPGPASESVACSCTSFHRRRVFVNSLSDWLDPRWPIETLARTLDVWRRCPDIEIIACTKRPELFDRRLQSVIEALERYAPLESWLIEWAHAGNAPLNITVLASVENQEQADKRIPHLLRIPAVRRGLSLEPLLGPVVLREWLFPVADSGGVTPWGSGIDIPDAHGSPLDWIIVGGDSGSKARPCNIEWIRSLVKQGQAAGVPVFVKQLGAFCITDNANMDDWPEGTRIVGEDDGFASRRVMVCDKKGADSAEWPEDLRVQQFSKY